MGNTESILDRFRRHILRTNRQRSLDLAMEFRMASVNLFVGCERGG